MSANIPGWSPEIERGFKEILFRFLEEIQCTRAALYLYSREEKFLLATQYGFGRRDVLAIEHALQDPMVRRVRDLNGVPAAFNRKHDMIAVKISDPRETQFENVGLIELEDAETGEVVLINTASREFRREFEARAEEDITTLKRDLRLANVDFINIRTNESYIIPLVNFFKMREKRH